MYRRSGHLESKLRLSLLAWEIQDNNMMLKNQIMNFQFEADKADGPVWNLASNWFEPVRSIKSLRVSKNQFRSIRREGRDFL